MKVLLVNGSPRPKGCTFTALSEVASELERQGVEAQIFQLGAQPVAGCIACGKCAILGQCFRDDKVNEFLSLASEADGFVFGSPVYFASVAGQLECFLDRVFYAGGELFTNKPGAVVVSCRRGGASAAFDQLNKYFGIRNMPVVSSNYWNQVHGFTPEDVRQDLEGLATMRQLGRNMAWMLKCFEAGKKAGVPLPEAEPTVRTNFIR
ncbi:flavodoxin family protein [uncultured Mailhella sp.]|uniref:flavodoxin family protein n=1 Tax=uncultured Mailhella sp. TaxID=1981031 RepID=UPI00260B42C1|nr:flavodoxin family protein [uncultured Mailhella sp.]